MKKYNAEKDMKKLISNNIGKASKFSERKVKLIGKEHENMFGFNENSDEHELYSPAFTSRIVREMIFN